MEILGAEKIDWGDGIEGDEKTCVSEGGIICQSINRRMKQKSGEIQLSNSGIAVYLSPFIFISFIPCNPISTFTLTSSLLNSQNYFPSHPLSYPLSPQIFTPASSSTISQNIGPISPTSTTSLPSLPLPYIVIATLTSQLLIYDWSIQSFIDFGSVSNKEGKTIFFSFLFFLIN